jgi:hypothetical protein
VTGMMNVQNAEYGLQYRVDSSAFGTNRSLMTGRHLDCHLRWFVLN